MALSLECSVLYYGAHHDDWAGNAYPDCSREFVAAMNNAIMEGTGGELHMEAPFVEWYSKADIVKKGLELNVPYVTERGLAMKVEINHAGFVLPAVRFR